MSARVGRALEDLNIRLRKLGETKTILGTIIRVNSVKGKIVQLEAEFGDLIRSFQVRSSNC